VTSVFDCHYSRSQVVSSCQLCKFLCSKRLSYVWGMKGQCISGFSVVTT